MIDLPSRPPVRTAGLVLATLGLCVATIANAAPAPARRKPAPVAQSEGPRFSRWIEDLPVMPGLYETDAGYSFEVARGGRLAEVRLHGVVEPQVVRSFYASTLPALGWAPQAGAAYAYERGRERLILHVSPAKPQGILAVFVLTPNPSPAPTAAAPAAAEPDGRGPDPSPSRKQH